MLLRNKRVAIVGGGPGGLMLARLLQLNDVQVAVYERDTDQQIRSQGATLDLHEESGLAAIRKAGLLDEFYARHRPGAGLLKVLSPDMQVHIDDHAADQQLADSRPEIDRADLREMLLASLKPDTVHWDHQFSAMTPQNTGWTIHFRNQPPGYADLVIAADGANSKLRPYMTDIQPVYSGITIVEGNIYHAEKNAPNLWQLVSGGKIFALGHEQSIILSAKGDGSLSFYTGCKVEEAWASNSGINFTSKRDVFAWFKTAFAAWHVGWQELFDSDDMWFVPRPQYHFPLDQSWITHPNVTMLGDAAHRMPPYAGEGVNMALQDALELSEYLSVGASIPEALAAYERAMLQRAAEVTRITLESTEGLHSRDGVKWIGEVFSGEH
ncbi:FAD-dependent monooxygenase [Chitinophaga horti]|uniref:Flavin-dependent monooxygenase n=1 Tax=Chitinophaga horti TaxID=2920382 RepID=A0ABY6JBT3_9BACT|nr:NAD(P)/FAD-dependent oxidoreductase [Chitinophaga horti]UYQ95867.1 FAD-dependent monooxygenase [Chitinophaga horti]